MYPNVVVPGSLSITLILAIARQYFSHGIHEFSIQQAKYVMYRPLYADEKVTLTITENKKEGEKKMRYRAIIWTPSFEKAVECIIHPHS